MHSDSIAFDVSIHATTNGPPHAAAVSTPVGKPSFILANNFPNDGVADGISRDAVANIVTNDTSNSFSNYADQRSVGIADRLRTRS